MVFFLLFLLIGIIIPDSYLIFNLPSRMRGRKVVIATLISCMLIVIGAATYMGFFTHGLRDFKKAAGFMWFIWGWFLLYMPKWFYIISSIWKYPMKWVFKRRFPLFDVIGVIAAGYILYVFIEGTFWGRYDYQVKHVEITSELLPPAFDGVKIVQISDIHLGNFGQDKEILRKVVELVNQQDADFIFQTGDIINNQAEELYENQFFLGEMKAKRGKYAVLGNHDYGDYVNWPHPEDKLNNLKELCRLQEQLGFRMLNNESVVLRCDTDSIALVGVENWGEPPFTQHGDLKKAINAVEQIPYKILLSHNPIHFDEEVKQNYDINLTLAGHTHAMQMVVKLFGKRYSLASIRYPKWGGLYEENDKYLYVNEGIGYVLYPMRYQTGPEITVLELKRRLK